MGEQETPLQRIIRPALTCPDRYCERRYYGKRVGDRVPEAMVDWQVRAVEIAIKPYLKEEHRG